MSAHAIVLVEDDGPTRERLELALAGDPSLRVVGSCGTVAEGLVAIEQCRPDVLLTDLGLPDGDGLRLIEAQTRGGEGRLAMVITVFGDEERVLRCIAAGASGYLLKDSEGAAVRAGVIELLAGGSPLSPRIARHILRSVRATPGPSAPSSAPSTTASDATALTPREIEVLTLCAKGFTYSEIAEVLGNSRHTVTTHARRIYKKLAVGSQTAAIYEAVQLGIIRLD